MHATLGTALNLEARTIYTATESKFGLNRRHASFPSWHASWFCTQENKNAEQRAEEGARTVVLPPSVCIYYECKTSCKQ